MSEQLRIGLALASGGARGLAHAGVLAVLEEDGIRPAAIAGTSMGAIVGGLYAEEPDAEVAWRKLRHYVSDTEFAAAWRAFVARDSLGGEEPSGRRFQELWEFVQRKLIALRTVTRPHLVEREKLRGPLEDLFRARTFADLRIPFAAVAVDLVSGERVVFREGDLIEAIYASSAIPGVFPPLERDGMVVCDGGAAYRTPVDECRALGAEVVVAVDIPSFVERRYQTGMELIMRNDSIARQRLNDFAVARADLVIRPAVQDVHWADFRAADTCRERGAEATRQALPKLRSLAAARRRRFLGLRRRLARILDPRRDGPVVVAGSPPPQVKDLAAARGGKTRRR